MMKYNHRGSKIISPNQNMEFWLFPRVSVVSCVSTDIIQVRLSSAVKKQHNWCYSIIFAAWVGLTVLSSVSARSFINIRKMKRTQRC